MAGRNLIQHCPQQIDVAGKTDLTGKLFFFHIKANESLRKFDQPFVFRLLDQSLGKTANANNVALIKKETSLFNAKLLGGLLGRNLNFFLLGKVVGHFRSHVHECSPSTELAGITSQIKGHPKVNQQHLAVVSDHDVVGLEVAVNNFH